MTQDNIFSQAPAVKPACGDAENVVIFLHGYGASGDDLIGLAWQWQEALPQTAFFAPHAPMPCPMSPQGRMWFSLEDATPAVLWREVERSATHLIKQIDHLLESLNLSGERCLLVGFSQGAALAAYAGLYGRKVAGVLAYAGFLAVPPERKPPRFSPDLFFLHGEADTVIPLDIFQASLSFLDACQIPYRFLTEPGLGHTLSPRFILEGGQFLQDVLKLRKK